MKKYLFLATIMLIILCIQPVTEADVWDGFEDNTETGYLKGEGALGINISPGNLSSNIQHIDTHFNLNYGLQDTTRLDYNFHNYDFYTAHYIELKHHFYNRDSLRLSIEGGLSQYSYKTSNSTSNSMSLKLLSDKVINDQLTLYNHLLLEYNDGYLDKNIYNSFKYKINDRQHIKLMLSSFFKSRYEDYFRFKGAYKHVLNKNTNYILYISKYTDNKNTFIRNIIEHTPEPSLSLDFSTVLNTGNSPDFYFIIEGEKSISESLEIEGTTLLDFEDEYYTLSFGVDYLFD
ncbi:hypothetical protein [Halothermothrix orenii]|uniref:Uncharacterized protein n=1 Tax=Halothermothrix orenii (strain H 168 / OCM 544 / DSM 9562) TaxID=373903 RepID=B8CYW9_HALOH|nr:hypothetical protein [Halothermothrix orenii]ACL70488.1 hypothetical protein Hore_17390 [Halothermothrix orenii H 168]